MVEIWSGVSKSLTNVATGGKIIPAKYTINDDYIYVETGVLSSKAEQYPLWAVRDIDFSQSLMQKARSVANLRIRFEHNDFTGKSEVILENVEAGRELVGKLTEAFTAARLEHQRLAQTQHLNYQGVPPMSPSSAPQIQTAPSQDDVIAKLEQLGSMLEKGILTKEEFDAQKAKLLGL